METLRPPLYSNVFNRGQGPGIETRQTRRSANKEAHGSEGHNFLRNPGGPVETSRKESCAQSPFESLSYAAVWSEAATTTTRTRTRYKQKLQPRQPINQLFVCIPGTDKHRAPSCCLTQQQHSGYGVHGSKDLQTIFKGFPTDFPDSNDFQRISKDCQRISEDVQRIPRISGLRTVGVQGSRVSKLKNFRSSVFEICGCRFGLQLWAAAPEAHVSQSIEIFLKCPSKYHKKL